jgi:hypothetical protein
MAQEDSSLEDFFQSLSQPNEITNEGEKWVSNNLKFETKQLLKQKVADIDKYSKYKKELFDFKIRNLKQTISNDNYGDEFNKIVCTTADRLNLSLPEAESMIKKEIENDITDKDIKEYLAITLRSQKEKRLKPILAKNLEKAGDIEKALLLTSVQYEIDRIKTDKVWGADKFEKTILNGLNGEKVNLISMLCLINKYDNNGGYTAIDNLDGYLNNPQLKPIPLIISEIFRLTQFLRYYGISSSLTLYVADTDYTETGRYGNITAENVGNIQKYIQNIREFVTTLSNEVSVFAFSETVKNNPLYLEVKQRILKNVSTFKDDDFTRKWYKSFENSVEKISESQAKKKLFSPDEIRQKSLEITRKIWACNSAEGVVFGTLGENTIFVSAENRERDQNYMIDIMGQKTFPPTIYVLQETERWYKITGKGSVKQV